MNSKLFKLSGLVSFLFFLDSVSFMCKKLCLCYLIKNTYQKTETPQSKLLYVRSMIIR